MKRMFKSLLLAASISSPFVAPICAQNGAVTEIPFQFTVGSQTLPAGQYTLGQPLADKSLFSFSDANGRTTMALLASRSADTNEQATLTFVCYNSKTECILWKVAPGVGETAFAIPESRLDHYRAHKLGIASLVSVKLH